MGRIRDVHIRVDKPTSWVNSFLFTRLQGTIRASERSHDLPAYELFLVFPLVKLTVAPPSAQVKGGVEAAALTSLPGVETQARGGERTEDRATEQTSLPLMFPRCPEVCVSLVFLP